MGNIRSLTLINESETTSTGATAAPSGDFRKNWLFHTPSSDFSVSNPSGTPRNGNILVVRFEASSTARNVTWGTSYFDGGPGLPPTTVLNKVTYLVFIYNSNTSKWELVDKVTAP